MKKWRIDLSTGTLFLQDNAPAWCVIMQTVRALRFDIFELPSYLPDMTPFDCYDLN